MSPGKGVSFTTPQGSSFNRTISLQNDQTQLRLVQYDQIH